MSKNPMDQEVVPPRAGTVQRIAVSTTAANTALDERLRGLGWIRVKAITANVELFFNKDVATTPPVLGAVGVGAIGYPILAGTWEEFFINDDTHVAWDASATGELVILRCGTERVRHDR
jgi:hypothetical protein